MINKRIGDRTEKKILDFISKKGWWCHLFAYNVNGQPCDVIALKENKSLLIDVKHCDAGSFSSRRIEPNQATCFTYASSLGVKCGFALYNECDQQIYWLPWEMVGNIKTFKVNALNKFEEVL